MLLTRIMTLKPRRSRAESYREYAIPCQYVRFVYDLYERDTNYKGAQQ